MKNHSTDNISKNRQQEILKFKNNISEEILLNCNIETWKCEFNIQNSEIKEMAEYLKSSQAVCSTGHNIPYASINFTENKTDNYFKINVGFYNLLNMKGCAVFRLSLYNNDKSCSTNSSFHHPFNRLRRNLIFYAEVPVASYRLLTSFFRFTTKT